MSLKSQLYHYTNLNYTTMNMSIGQHHGNSKYLYKVVSDLSGSKVDNPLPDTKLDDELAEAFQHSL